MNYPSWAPPELKATLEDKSLPPLIVSITCQLTIEAHDKYVPYAKAFWNQIQDSKHAVGAIFMALIGGYPDSKKNIQDRNADISKHAKALSRLLKNKTSLDLVRLDSLDTDIDCTIYQEFSLTPFFHLSDVLDSLNDIPIDTYTTKSNTNISRDTFIQTLGKSFKDKYGSHMYGTIMNAYNLTHDDEITIDIARGRFRKY